jgi:phosphoribosyl-dephospho-CoA transferase
MNFSEIGDPQVHDLVRIDPDCLTAGSVARPSWVTESLMACPWAVVRRAEAPAGQIAVGVRGTARSERWGGFYPKILISKIVQPAELLALARSSSWTPRTPALKVLQVVIERWRGFTLSWGPTGSAGFELVCGCKVTTAASDLDIAIHATQRIALEQARFLWDRVTGLQTKVDVRVETFECGFSLEEYVRTSSGRILLRYPEGPTFGVDPWNERPSSEVTVV